MLYHVWYEIKAFDAFDIVSIQQNDIINQQVDAMIGSNVGFEPCTTESFSKYHVEVRFRPSIPDNFEN